MALHTDERSYHEHTDPSQVHTPEPSNTHKRSWMRHHLTDQKGPQDTASPCADSQAAAEASPSEVPHTHQPPWLLLWLQCATLGPETEFLL